MTRRWGKAGVRLTAQEAAARDRAAVARREQGTAARDEQNRQARIKWAAGMVVPHRITMALDRHQLHGPDVDRACGVEEPAVDMWEAGRLYPSWEQLCALAELTHVTPSWFCLPPPAPLGWSSLDIHFPPHPDDPPAVHHFTRAALDDAADMGVRA